MLMHVFMAAPVTPGRMKHQANKKTHLGLPIDQDRIIINASAQFYRLTQPSSRFGAFSGH
jgi:hypothetical protein